MVVVFTVILISVLYYQFEYSFTTQDSILDAHENYYYSQMVSRWGNPPDTNSVINEINNLHIWCGIFKKERNINGDAYPGEPYWSNLPNNFSTEDVVLNSISTYFEELHDVEIPLLVYYAEDQSSLMPVTIVDNGNYLFYLVIDYIPPSEIKNLVFAIILSTLFIVGLYFFISKYLRPVQLMKSRIIDLERGDLKSKIEIIGNDELADLSISMNKLIGQINILLENKHQLLLEVSHELRSPLARMQLIIEMMPAHEKKNKLIEELDFLEGMISNLLLSDRLSLPYSKLDLKKYKTNKIVSDLIGMFPTKKEIINIINDIPNYEIIVDETKFILALRNLIDNALKYNINNKKVDLIIKKNKTIDFYVKDFGIGIDKENIKKLTQPFYQADQTVSTKGFGLGLTICKKIIESHDGHLSISSNKSKGSTFGLHLPNN